MPGPYNIEEPDNRPIAEQEKRLDVRSLNTKKAALRRVFDRFANKEGLVKVAKLLVDCEENPTILLEACPKHARDLPLALERVVTDGGLMDWAAFRDCGLLCMSQGQGLSRRAGGRLSTPRARDDNSHAHRPWCASSLMSQSRSPNSSSLVSIRRNAKKRATFSGLLSPSTGTAVPPRWRPASRSASPVK